MKDLSNLIGNQTNDIPARSADHQQTAQPSTTLSKVRLNSGCFHPFDTNSHTWNQRQNIVLNSSLHSAGL